MVLTRLWDVTSKGSEVIASGGTHDSTTATSPDRPQSSSLNRTIDTSTTNSNIPSASQSPHTFTMTSNSPDSYWNSYSTMQSMYNAATSMSSMFSFLYRGNTPSTPNNERIDDHNTTSFSMGYNLLNSMTSPFFSNPLQTVYDSSPMENDFFLEDDNDDDNATIQWEEQYRSTRNHQQNLNRSQKASTATTWSKTPYADLVWMFRHDKNPYNAVRGRDIERHRTSMTAIRSLVALVPTTTNKSCTNPKKTIQPSSSTVSHTSHLGDETDSDPTSQDVPTVPKTKGTTSQESTTIIHNNQQQADPSYVRNQHNTTYTTYNTASAPSTRQEQQQRRQTVSASETASQLAEGTIRALRDMALDEAVELQIALRYWNLRWERPLLSWLEAGPFVWTSSRGYNHQEVGRRVSQIQAVLARRVAAVGELQSHLLRAGWHRGVAQWGVLGQGGQWAPVAGFDGYMPDHPDLNPKSTPRNSRTVFDHSTTNDSGPFSPDLSVQNTPIPSASQRKQIDEKEIQIIVEQQNMVHNVDKLLRPSAGIPENESSFRVTEKPVRQSSHAQVFVGRKHGDGIYVDDPGFLAEWSVEAISLVRRHLFRAGNGKVSIPYESNWIYENRSSSGMKTMFRQKNITNTCNLPLWAREMNHNLVSSLPDGRTGITITDISLLVAEVQELLDIMEGLMEVQRQRRLDRLRSPSWFRRNWYILATVLPSLAFVLRRLGTKGYGKQVIRFTIQKVSTFFRERVTDPIVAIFKEVWQGRESFSDKKAREEAIESLKKMIRSWLDDTFPNMPEAERIAMSEAMDITMVEKVKEQSMRTFYEINNVIRMSFIEMQYMKKEMMAALHAMDEMMSANDINMNLAAITPAVLLVYGSARVFRFLFFGLLKLRESREETYSSFRHVLTDIERLLVMRDNPPLPPPSIDDPTIVPVLQSPNQPCVLGSDDLGMLMLLIHECRTILWKGRSRFSPAIIRSVSEDLAELAGERGAVSVQQQLSITGRMCRTYPFLKVVSTGHLFQSDRLAFIY